MRWRVFLLSALCLAVISEAASKVGTKRRKVRRKVLSSGSHKASPPGMAAPPAASEPEEMEVPLEAGDALVLEPVSPEERNARG